MKLMISYSEGPVFFVLIGIHYMEKKNPDLGLIYSDRSACVTSHFCFLNKYTLHDKIMKICMHEPALYTFAYSEVY